MKRIPIVTLLLVLGLTSILSVSSCAKKMRAEALSERAEKFNRSIRWSSLNAASTLIADKTRRTLMQELADDLRKNRIVEYSIIDLGLDKEKKSASIIVEYSYFSNAEQSLRYRQQLQTWEYDSDKGDWFIHGAKILKVEDN